MNDVAWALNTARGVGPIPPPHAHAHPIHKAHLTHTGPLHSSVAGRTDHLPSQVPNGSFVLPADIVSALGEGNTMSGFKAAKRMFEGAKRHFGGLPYAGGSGPYGQSGGPYGMADGGEVATSQPSPPVNNPAFNRWFEGSHVADERGLPAPQYHSTSGDFSSFRTGPTSGLKLMDGLGAHFGTAQAANDRLRKNYGKTPPEGSNVMPVYLSIKKPLTKRDGSVMDEGELQSHLSKVASKIGIEKSKHRAYSSAYPMRGETYNKLKSELVRQGYDGIPYRNSHEDRGSTSWIAFHPHQIKSATGNRGTFDPANPDITMASGGGIDTANQAVPVAVAGGEHVLAPHEVAFAGMGDNEAGHKALTAFVLRQRAKLIKDLRGLAPPKND